MQNVEFYITRRIVTALVVTLEMLNKSATK